MNWLVTLEFQNGGTCTERVNALNKSDAMYRAAIQAEIKYNKAVACAIKASKN